MMQAGGERRKAQVPAFQVLLSLLWLLLPQLLHLAAS